MSKDYKGYELIKEIADGNIKDGTTIGVFDLSVCDIFVTNIVYKNKKLLWLEGKFDTSYLLNPNCYFRIVEEQEEIDMQELEDVNLFDNGQNFKDLPIIIKSYDDNFTNINNTINKLVQAVKYLDNKLKEK